MSRSWPKKFENRNLVQTLSYSTKCNLESTTTDLVSTSFGGGGGGGGGGGADLLVSKSKISH